MCASALRQEVQSTLKKLIKVQGGWKVKYEGENSPRGGWKGRLFVKEIDFHSF